MSTGRLIALCLVALLTGCGWPDHSDAIQRNNSFVEALEAKRNTLLSTDTASLKAYRIERLDYLMHIDSVLSLRGDTLDLVRAQKLEAFSNFGAPYHPPSIELDRMHSRIERSIDQLMALNHDLEHNLIPLDSVDYLLQLERLSAKTVMEEAQLLQEAMDNELHKMDAWLLKKDSITALIGP